MENDNTQNTSSNWYNAEGIDQSLITDKVKSFTNADGTMNIGEFVKSYNESQSYIGGAVRIPKENASENEVNAFYSKLGRPEKYTDYDWKVPEGTEVRGDVFDEFKKSCHKLGLTNKQFSGVLNRYVRVVQDLHNQDVAYRQEQEQTTRANLQREWGDKFESKLNGVMKLFEELGIKEELEASGKLYDERYIKAFHKISTDSMPAQAVVGDSSLDSISARLLELQKNPAYLNSADPQHKAVVEEFNNLYIQKAKMSR